MEDMYQTLNLKMHLVNHMEKQQVLQFEMIFHKDLNYQQMKNSKV